MHHSLVLEYHSGQAIRGSKNEKAPHGAMSRPVISGSTTNMLHSQSEHHWQLVDYHSSPSYSSAVAWVWWMRPRSKVKISMTATTMSPKLWQQVEAMTKTKRKKLLRALERTGVQWSQHRSLI